MQALIPWIPALMAFFAIAVAWGKNEARVAKVETDNDEHKKALSAEFKAQREELKKDLENQRTKAEETARDIAARIEREKTDSDHRWQSIISKLENELTAQRESSEKRGSDTVARLDRILDKGEDTTRRVMRVEDRVVSLDEKYAGLIESTRDTLEGAIRRIDAIDHVLHTGIHEKKI